MAVAFAVCCCWCLMMFMFDIMAYPHSNWKRWKQQYIIYLWFVITHSAYNVNEWNEHMFRRRKVFRLIRNRNKCGRKLLLDLFTTPHMYLSESVYVRERALFANIHAHIASRESRKLSAKFIHAFSLSLNIYLISVKLLKWLILLYLFRIYVQNQLRLSFALISSCFLFSNQLWVHRFSCIDCKLTSFWFRHYYCSCVLISCQMENNFESVMWMWNRTEFFVSVLANDWIVCTQPREKKLK